MDIDRYGWVKDGMIPFVETDGLTFYGLPGDKYPDMFEVIAKNVEIRFNCKRNYIQHKHYEYKETDVVVEVGAYLGYYSMRIAPQVKKVVAIEMLPELCKVMDMNLEPYPNAISVMKGASNKQGKGTARQGEEQKSSLRADIADQFSLDCKDVEVELDTLDNILDQHGIDMVDMVIIQVNGSEKEVLEGLDLKRVKNFAIAIPYSEGVVDLLSGFEVIVDNDIMVYGQASGLAQDKEVA